MLNLLTIEEKELYNSETSQFIQLPGMTIELEHSLYTVSKWEEVTEKTFFNEEGMTLGDQLLYIQIMSGYSIPYPVLKALSKKEIDCAFGYVNSKNSATRIKRKETKVGTSSEGISSELIYYWMISYGIPIEAQRWHLNRLLTLIQIFDVKNSPKEKMSLQEQLKQQHDLNEQRKRALHTKG